MKHAEHHRVKYIKHHSKKHSKRFKLKHLKHYKYIIGFFAAFVFLLLCAVIIDTVGKHNEVNDKNINTEINVVLPEKIYVANEAVVEWMNGTQSAKEIYGEYREYGRLDYTKAFDFLYSIDNLPVNYRIESQHISIVDKDCSKEVFSQSISTEKRSVSIENLRPDTNYEYLIQVSISKGQKIEKSGTFKTEPSLCFLFINGARNVRDIGTLKTVDGRQIKKYMVYRGSEIDGAVEPIYTIKQDGIEYMLNALNIRTELDLRWYDYKTMKDVLGSKVKHSYYPTEAYNDFFDTDYSNENSKMIFSELANPDAYPVYIHCTRGTDRTGTIMYILEALLGVNEDNLYRDWECSVLCLGDSFYEDMHTFIQRFKQLPGNTMQEKAENYLLSIGVTKQEIDSIREILLTD